MKKIVNLALSFLISGLLAFPAGACVGADMYGRGCAGTASVTENPVEGTYWNPAAIVLSNEKINLTYFRNINNRDGFNYNDYISGTTKISENETIGISYISSSFNKNYIFHNFKESFPTYSVTYAKKINIKTAIGISLKSRFYKSTTHYKIANISKSESENGVGFDLGLIYQPDDRWSVGVLIQDIGLQNLKSSMLLYDSEKYGVNIRPGVSYKPSSKTMISFEYYDLLHVIEKNNNHFRLGIDQKIGKNLVIRAGNDRGNNSFGLGIISKNIQTDWAYLPNNKTSFFSLTTKF